MKFPRALALCAVLGFSFLAAGCGGQSGGTPPLQPQDGMGNVPAVSATAPGERGTMSTTSTSSGLIGQVTYMTFFSSSGEFQVKTTSGALVWVYTNSSTQWTYNGLALKVGEWVSAGGAYSSSTAYKATSVSLSTSQPATTSLSTASTASYGLVGQVTYMTYFGTSGDFQVRTTSGALVWVYTNSSTPITYNGLSMKVGDWVGANGSYKTSTAFYATSVTLSSTQPTGTTSASSYGLVGQVTYMTYFTSSGDFQVRTTSGALVWVYTNSSTPISYNGLSMKVGDWVGANGSYKTSTAFYATSVSLSSTQPTGTTTTSSGSATPAPVANVPKHVQTAEYLTTSVETQTNPSVYAPYLTWAYTTTGRLGMTQSAGIKTVLYTTPIMPYYTNYEYTALNGTYAASKAKTCSGVTVTTWSGHGLLSDPTKSTTASYFQNIVNHVTSAAKSANPGYSQPWNLLYVDDAGPLYGSSATPCNYDASTWGVAMDNDLATTGQKFILNSLAVSTTNIPTYVARLKGSAISGGEFEECFTSTTWTQEGDSQLQSVALLKSQGKPGGAGFWCYADNTSATGSLVIPQRLFVYASFLLTYDPNYSVFQESFTTSPSTFKVFPETGFVPLSPASTPTSIANLQTSSGAYLRQYNACYYRGSLIGKCEVIANPGTGSVAVPNPWGLHHSMVLSGGGILDGGSASFSGSAPSTMGPHTGLILTP